MQICSPEYKVMYIHSQCIQEIGNDELPVSPEILENISIISAVFLEITFYCGTFQCGYQHEAEYHAKKHAKRTFHIQNPYHNN